MNIMLNWIQKFFIFEASPQKIGLTQFKEPIFTQKKLKVSVKNKDIKLSDLMRRT